MIGIIGAMSVETDSLKEQITDKTTRTISGIEFVCGMLENKQVVVAKCGIGKVFAAMCAQTMILHYNPDVIINTGVAGSLCKELGICSVAVGTDVVQYDIDTSALGDPVGLVSGPNIVNIPCSDKACKLIKSSVEAIGNNVLCGTIGSADRFLATADEKQAVAKSFNAIACDMESGSIAQVCFANNVPCGILRAISDSFGDDSAMDYNDFLILASQASVDATKIFIKSW